MAFLRGTARRLESGPCRTRPFRSRAVFRGRPGCLAFPTLALRRPAATPGARKSAPLLTRAQVPAVIAEVNRFGLAQLGLSEQELRTLMTDLGYTTYALVGDLPVRLAPHEPIQSSYIYNVLFANPQLQEMVADRWPQDAKTEMPPPGRAA